MQRRKFIAAGLTASVASTLTPLTATPGKTPSPFPRVPAHKASYKISLKGDAIGVNLGPMEMIERAKKYGYEALSVPSQWIVPLNADGRKRFAAAMRTAGLRYGANGIPIEFRKSQEQFDGDLAALPEHARALQDIGVDRIGTWIMPMHAERGYRENFDLHADRLGRVAKVLADHGLRLGLEYVGTQSTRFSERFAFIGSGAETKELIDAMGVDNVGVVLDSWHWHNAREGADAITMWDREDIVAVDLNDATPFLNFSTYADLSRELPGATGVIDLTTFLGTLNEIGYDGPVRAEPFSASLNAMRPELSLPATFEAIHGAIEKAGLA